MDSVKEKEFNEIYNSYSKMLFGIIFSYTKERTLAEDILEEVFITYLTKGPKNKNNEYIKNWLIRVSINKSINEYNKRKKELIDDNILIVSSDKEDEEDKKIVLNEVYSLPEKLKLVIILYYFNEMKINEISKALNVKESAVKMRLKNARDILKERLKKHEIY